MKPREFWLCETGFSAGDGYSEYAVTETAPIENIKDHVHVREVVPIDWEKVWKEHEYYWFGLQDNEYKFIQELIEKQLKGEE